jgi:acyl-CoA thioesterase-1
MKPMAILLAILLTACGGSETPPSALPAKAPPPYPSSTAIVFVGDSITAGWNLPSGYINAGVSGEWSELMYERFDRDVMAHHPAIVSILAGTNDVRLYQQPPLEFIAKMAEHAAASGACVIIGTVPPNSVWGVGVTPEWGVESIPRFNELLKAFAPAYGYLVADYNPVLEKADGSIDLSLFVDGIHPTDEGHDKMWAVVAPLIARCKVRLGLTP